MKGEITQHPTCISFSENLKKLNLRFPNKDLVEKLGYSSGNVSAYTKGIKMPSGKFLQKFYEVYLTDIEKAEAEIERKRTEKHSEAVVPFPLCENCLLKEREISELKGQVKLLKELLKDASDNNKTKAISA